MGRGENAVQYGFGFGEVNAGAPGLWALGIPGGAGDFRGQPLLDRAGR